MAKPKQESVQETNPIKVLESAISELQEPSDKLKLMETFFNTLATSRKIPYTPDMVRILSRLAGLCREEYSPTVSYRADGKEPIYNPFR